ncbi:MAG: hypothetical protein WB608_26115 [Terracidiphilus sp.]
MNQTIHDQAYLAAFDASRTELGEILAKFELLQARRETMEKIVEALKPIIDSTPELVIKDQETASAPVESRDEPLDPHCFLVQHQAEYVPAANEQAQDASLDSIQRRISSALGMGAVA